MKLEFGKYIGYNQNPDWCESYCMWIFLYLVMELNLFSEHSFPRDYNWTHWKRWRIYFKIYHTKVWIFRPIQYLPFSLRRNDTIYPTSVQQDKDLFQSLLDAELNKIEKFYLAQEKKLIHLYYQIGSVQPEEGDKPKFFLTCFNIFMNCEYENTKEKLKREMVDFFKKVCSRV